MAHLRLLVPSALLVAGCASRPASAPAPAAPAAPATPATPATPAASAAAPAPAPADPFAAHNLGFEDVDGTQPRAWALHDGRPVAVDSAEKHGGARSLRLEGSADGFRAAVTKLDVAQLRGKRLRLHGWLKTQAASVGAALLIRADGAQVAIEAMRDRMITGTAAWTPATIELDVPAGATGVSVGGLILGSGTAWLDDLRIEVAEPKAPAEVAIEGVVTDAAGAPLSGAEVALIGASSDVAQHVRTGADGRFRFAAVPAGTWGLSAQRAGAVGAFVAQRRFDAPGEVRIALGKDGGVTVRGKLAAGTRPAAFVEISPVSQNDADVFVVPVAEGGTFEAILPRGDQYNVSVLGGSEVAVAERAGDRALVTLAFGPPPAEVVTYIGARGIPLASVEAGTGFADLAPLGKLVGGARIVALGEATHGTREFFQMKHRLLEYLVAKQGFTVFAIEANQPECRAVNDYVLHGTGTARDALAGIAFWSTEEVLAMIEWMRAWNADPAHPQKVLFTGFDMQMTFVPHASVTALLEKVAPDQAKAWLAPIAVLGGRFAMEAIAKASPEERGKIGAGLAALARAFDANRKAWTAAAGAAAYTDARHDLTILAQALEMHAAAGAAKPTARDRAMADNVGWLLEQTRAKLVLWAHNGHVSNVLPAFPNMGGLLRARYKQAYVNIGFVFGEGSFRASDLTKPARGAIDVKLGPPPESHGSVAFSRTGKPLLALDLRALPQRGPVRDWFAQQHAVREVGYGFSSEREMTGPQVLPQRYDAVIFVDKTTASRPLPPRASPR
ncbi:MAG TPA: erythromycin esterase family protein [Kofleriaceae bacterium]|nr:erythromycin esterase family protein [Kofleriaceae bacterium]